MKAMKKLSAVLLAAIMLLSLSITAFAATGTNDNSGSITINDAVPGQTYSVYQIFQLESYNTDPNNDGNTSDAVYTYVIKSDSAWYSFVNTGAGKDYVTLQEFETVNSVTTYYVTWTEGKDTADDVAAFAKAAQAYAADTSNSITATKTATAPAATGGQTYSAVSFTNLNLGYYLVDTTLGTLCSLDTTKPSVTIEEKNEAPTNVKTVEEDSNNTYGEKNDADIGQTVNFKSTVTLPVGSENIVFHDTMSNGLTLDATSIKVYTNSDMTTELTAANYTVKTTGLTDGCTFEVSFAETYLDGLTATATVYVGYSATLNENAVVGGNGNSNSSKVDYGDDDHTSTTPDSTTHTYTWDVDIFKYVQGENNVKTPLSGATFTLSKSQNGSNPIALISKGNNVYRVAKSGETGTVTSITTDTTGKFTIEGLDSDTYYLTETDAPDGYNKLTDPVIIVIDANGNVNPTTDLPNGVTQVEVENKSGSLLPSTGGMGTTIFYILGAILVVGAGVLLIVRRRMNAEK